MSLETKISPKKKMTKNVKANAEKQSFAESMLNVIFMIKPEQIGYAILTGMGGGFSRNNLF